MPAPFRVLLGMSLALTAPPPPPPLPSLPVQPNRPLPSRLEPIRAQPGAITRPQPPLPGSLSQGQRSGRVVMIGGLRQQARWQWQPASPNAAEQLWLPLELLEGQLGISSRSRSDGSLMLEWYGRQLIVPAAAQRSFDDEVAVEVAALVRPLGLRIEARGDRLDLGLDRPPLVAVRLGGGGERRRVVLDLSAPSWIRREREGLILGLNGHADQLRQLQELGLRVRQTPDQLLLEPGPGQTMAQVLSLGGPYRIVVDLQGGGTATGPDPGGAPASEDLEAHLRAQLPAPITWRKQVLTVGAQRVLVNAIRLDPRNSFLALQPLTGANGMQGLSSLLTLASRQQALVAINGGYFNRVRRLPLGALREGGRWLSGPILQRGVMAWRPQQLPRFGRLQLEEILIDARGERWTLISLNSGYVQRGLSRYTADWGGSYTALSGGESALLIRQGRVQSLIDSVQLRDGQSLSTGDTLIVARGGVPLPGAPGDLLTLISRPSSDLGDEPNVIGGGPLLLSGGRIVLDGAQERFSPAFLSQGAPRTVVGSDGRQLWLLTLEGVVDSGPTLGETAQLVQQLGLQEALNLDGGSSTGLVLAGVHTVKGRGVAGAVHNGLGLVPLTSLPLITRTLPE